MTNFEAEISRVRMSTNCLWYFSVEQCNYKSVLSQNHSERIQLRNTTFLIIILYITLMAKCKTVVAPVSLQWRYCNLTLNHWRYVPVYIMLSIIMDSLRTKLLNEYEVNAWPRICLMSSAAMSWCSIWSWLFCLLTRMKMKWHHDVDKALQPWTANVKFYKHLQRTGWEKCCHWCMSFYCWCLSFPFITNWFVD